MDPDLAAAIAALEAATTAMQDATAALQIATRMVNGMNPTGIEGFVGAPDLVGEIDVTEL